MTRPERSLFELEWSRLRPYVRLDARGILLWIGLPILLVAASTIFLDETATVRSVYAIGSVLAALAAWGVSAAKVMVLWESNYKNWWLSMPHPREALVKAMAKALLRLQAYISFAIWATCAASSLVRLSLGKLEPGTVSPGSFLLDSFAYLILYAAFTLLFVSAGIGFMGMYSGRRVWLNVPYVLLFVAIISVMPAIGDYSTRIDRWLKADMTVLYALIALLLAKPFVTWTIRFAAVYGLKDLAAYRSGVSGREKKASKAGETSRGIGAGKRGFAALFALERSRYRHFFSLKSVRISLFAVAVLFAVLGYFNSVDHDNLIGVYRVILMPCCLAPAIILVTLNQLEANKKRLSWWLCFPHDRSKLLFSRLLAVWGVSLRILAVMLLAFGAGWALQALILGESAFNGASDARTMLFLLLVYVGGGVAISCVMLGQSYAYRSSVYAWLSMPIVAVLYLLPFLVSNRILPEESLQTGVSDKHWLAFAAIAVVLAPIALLCFRLGAKWMHLYLLNTQEDIARRRHLGDRGK